MMAVPSSAALETEIESIYRLYLGLMGSKQQDNLGGKLLCAGAPDPAGCHLLRAANIAGAASLVSSEDASGLREAMRSGAIDFVVNSLDEALRILKNEIRKQQPVAVGVSVAPELLLAEMLERGVQPDLLAPALAGLPEIGAFINFGACFIEPQSPPPGMTLKVLPIPPNWSRPVAVFDSLLLDCLAGEDALNRRWVRLAPRYLPGETRRLRSVACSTEALGRLNSLAAGK